MKKLLVLLLAVFITLPAISQVKFGLKVGASTTFITMDDAKTITSGNTSYLIGKAESAGYGIHGGVFLRVNISKLYIQPEVLFATRSNSYTFQNVSSLADSATVKQTFNNLNIPVLIGLKFGPVRINAGPVGSVKITAKELIDNPDVKAVYAAMTFGYQAGVGLDLMKKLTIDLRYEGGLSKFQNKLEGVALDDRPNAFLLSVGYMF
jgi:hypothetical protein